MSTKGRFVKNTLSLMGSQVVIKALSFVLGIFLARYLGATDYGKYSFGYKYLAIFAPIAGLGLGQLVVREGARRKEELPVLVGTSMVLRFISSVCMVALAYIILQFITTTDEAKIVVYVFGIGFILEHLYGSVNLALAARERFDVYAVVQFLERVISFGLIVAILLFGYRLIMVSLIRPVTALIILLMSIGIVCIKILKSSLRVNLRAAPLYLKESWPFVADLLFVNMCLNVDSVMLQAMKGATTVGWYAIAAGLLGVCMPLQMVVISTVYPIFARTFINDQSTFSLYFERISRYLLSTGIAVSIALSFFAAPLVSLLYGKEFSQSIALLRIMIWALPLMSFSSLARAALMSCNLQRIPMWIGGGTVLVNVALNSCLIPFYGGHGAALATIFTQLVGCVILAIVIIKKTPWVNVGKSMLPLSVEDFRVIKELILKREKQ